jgi:hypothetical protein
VHINLKLRAMSVSRKYAVVPLTDSQPSSVHCGQQIWHTGGTQYARLFCTRPSRHEN